MIFIKRSANDQEAIDARLLFSRQKRSYGD